MVQSAVRPERKQLEHRLAGACEHHASPRGGAPARAPPRLADVAPWFATEVGAWAQRQLGEVLHFDRTSTSHGPHVLSYSPALGPL